MGCWRSSTALISLSCCSSLGIKTGMFPSTLHYTVPWAFHLWILPGSFFLERMLVSTTSSCEYDIPWYLHNFPVSWLSLPVSGLPHISLVRNTPVSHFLNANPVRQNSTISFLAGVMMQDLCSIIFTAAFGIVSHLWLNKWVS